MKKNNEKFIIMFLLCIGLILTSVIYNRFFKLEKVVYEPVLISTPITIECNDEGVPRQETEYEIAIKTMNHEFEQIKNIDSKIDWFIEYKDIIDKYSYIIDPPETIYDYFSEDEIYLIQRMVETETYQAKFEAKVNVANVALNRLESGLYGESIKEIITNPNQFAYHRKSISDSTILAVEYAFMFDDTTDGALSFHSNSKTNTFNRQKYIFTDSVGHHFYGKEKD